MFKKARVGTDIAKQTDANAGVIVGGADKKMPASQYLSERGRMKDDTETSKEPGNMQSSNVVVGGDVSKYQMLKDSLSRGGSHEPPKRPLLIGIILLLVVLVGAGIFFVLLSGSLSDAKNALTVSGDGKKFTLTRAQYATLLDQAKQQQVSQADAKQMIIKAYKYKIAAPSLHVEPSKDEVSTAARASSRNSDEASLNDWQQLYGYIAGVEGNIAQAKTGGYAAYKFIYPFDKVYYNESLTYSNPTPAAVEKARAPALAQATAGRQMLKAGKISANALIDKLHKDPTKLPAGGSNASKALNIDLHGVTYVDNDSLTYTEPDYVMTAINSLGNKPGISDITEMQATPYGAKSPVVIGYCFVSVTNNITANQDIENDLKLKLKTIEVTDHVE